MRDIQRTRLSSSPHSSACEPSREPGHDGSSIGARSAATGSDGNLRSSQPRSQGKGLGALVSDFGRKLSVRSALSESLRNVSSSSSAKNELKPAASLSRIAPQTGLARPSPLHTPSSASNGATVREKLDAKLQRRPSKIDLKLRNILRVDSQDSLPDTGGSDSRLERSMTFERRSEKLRSILKQRPTKHELLDWNILRGESDPNLFAERDRLRRKSLEAALESKLSKRPNLSEILDSKILNFAETVEVLPTFRKSEYNRKPDGNATFRKLTPQMKVQIREELNNFKRHEMPVHETSRSNTCFH
ncbi:hypothetical protein SeLEV6574_g06746 [Synchytrium endobioticum]|nr:hypothetical protein SeLEV6574_g06746 [Synchytrium endobioticum]